MASAPPPGPSFGLLILIFSFIISTPLSINTSLWHTPWRHSKQSPTSDKKKPLSSISPQYLRSTMSTCGDCSCADKSQCVKKGNSYGIDIVETEKSYVETVVMDVPAAEHEGNCKCGASCACTNCTCGQ